MSQQIQSTIYHPEVSRKALLSFLDSQMTPFWGHVTPDPGCDLPSRGVPKRGPQKCRFFGVPVFGPVLPRSSCNLPQNMVPGPKSTFWTHVTPDPGGVLPSEGVQKVTSNKKRLKKDQRIIVTWKSCDMVQKVVPIQKVSHGRWDGHEKIWFSWGRL